MEPEASEVPGDSGVWEHGMYQPLVPDQAYADAVTRLWAREFTKEIRKQVEKERQFKRKKKKIAKASKKRNRSK